MTFINSVASELGGLGVASLSLQRNGVATNVGTTEVDLPASGSFAVPPTIGIVRVKTATVGAASTSLVASIVGVNSANVSVNLFGGDVDASAAGTGIDHQYWFRTDLPLTSIKVSITVAVANCTHDVEVAGM